MHDIRKLTRRWFDEVWNQRRESTINELADPQALVYGLGEAGRTLHRPDEFRTFYNAFRSAFDDLHIDIDDILADGDKTVARLRFTGTHTGDGLGIPPTHRRFQSSAIVICRWRDGKIVEGWNEFDAAGMMAQLQPAGSQMKLKA